ncbi:LuxR family transcriptional regulator [Leptospira idonii]|uniref:LuxR family transcriptional regulator n=1 Tax=Leptospira idonii TaxID=1193500 RepID=A0A4R9LW44_9LEPT|nr:LuxR family transcriptional regulator [Leptospira idonii]TGN16928.1 LuxR family transcriptional regulator [Leptospira idonii]
MLENFFIIPLFAVFANLGCVLLNIGRDHPFHRLMLAFYFVVAIFNLSTVMLCLSQNEEQALFWWKYFNAGSWMALAPLVVGMVAFASGRNIFVLPTLIASIAAGLIFLMIQISPQSFIIGSKMNSFGMGPLLSNQGAIIGALPQLIGIGTSIYMLLRPVQWNDYFKRKFFTTAVILWWISLFANLITTSGADIPPLHPIADAIISVTLAIHLNRKSIGVPAPILFLSNLLISVSCGIVIGTLVGPYCPHLPSSEIFILAVSSLVSCAMLTFLKQRQQSALGDDTTPLSISLKEFGLSRQEIRICELIQEGHSRSFIQLVLNVSNGTLRNHLKNIYGKVLPPKKEKDTSKDQLQRLTIFLARHSGGSKNID